MYVGRSQKEVKVDFSRGNVRKCRVPLLLREQPRVSSVQCKKKWTADDILQTNRRDNISRTCRRHILRLVCVNGLCIRIGSSFQRSGTMKLSKICLRTLSGIILMHDDSGKGLNEEE